MGRRSDFNASSSFQRTNGRGQVAVVFWTHIRMGGLDRQVGLGVTVHIYPFGFSALLCILSTFICSCSSLVRCPTPACFFYYRTHLFIAYSIPLGLLSSSFPITPTSVNRFWASYLSPLFLDSASRLRCLFCPIYSVTTPHPWSSKSLHCIIWSSFSSSCLLFFCAVYRFGQLIACYDIDFQVSVFWFKRHLVPGLSLSLSY